MEKWIQELMEDAIHSKAEVLIEAQNGLGNYIITRFQPYIIGTDAFEFDFVWGYLPLTHSYYRFMLDTITRVILSENAYEANFDAIYQYASGEKHSCVLQGFEMIYNRSTLMDISPN